MIYCMLFCFTLDTEWVVANQELCDRQGFVVRNLPVGEKINFRVVAVNIAGRSPPAILSQAVTIREIVGESGLVVNSKKKTSVSIFRHGSLIVHFSVLALGFKRVVQFFKKVLF